MSKPSNESPQAEWVMGSLYPFESYIAGSVIPRGFEAYARILHPALKGSEYVTWSDIAAWAGRVVHPDMQFEAIATPAKGYGKAPKPWDGCVPFHMPEAHVHLLANVLDGFTSTPEQVWYLVWEGNGAGLYETQHLIAEKSQRRYYLNRASLEAFKKPRRLNTHNEPPEYWFPEDRSWCVATDMDIFWTYVGGSRECIDAILNCKALEAVPAALDQGLAIHSDPINKLTEEELKKW